MTKQRTSAKSDYEWIERTISKNKPDKKTKQKINVKMSHVSKQQWARKQIFVWTQFSHSTLKLGQKISSRAFCFDVTKITNTIRLQKSWTKPTNVKRLASPVAGHGLVKLALAWFEFSTFNFSILVCKKNQIKNWNFKNLQKIKICKSENVQKYFLSLKLCQVTNLQDLKSFVGH